jgi:hypothetical protein
LSNPLTILINDASPTQKPQSIERVAVEECPNIGEDRKQQIRGSTPIVCRHFHLDIDSAVRKLFVFYQ